MAAFSDRQFVAVFAGSRLLLFGLLFGIFHVQVRGDVTGYYFWQTRLRLQGLVPYRDFRSSYAPLFQDLLGLAYRIRPSPLSLVLLATAAEIAAVWVWLRVARALFRDDVVRTAALFYLLSSISLQFVTVDGQNNVYIELLIGAMLLCSLRGREALSGAVYALSICAVKFLPLLWLPAIAMFTRRTFAWLAGAAALVIGVYGYFVIGLHAPVLMPLSEEGGLKSAGDLPYVIEAVVGHDFGHRCWDLLLLLALGCVMTLTFGRFRRGTRASIEGGRELVSLLPVYLLLLMALAKKSWPAYTVMVLFPLSLVVAQAVNSLGEKVVHPDRKRRYVWRKFALPAFLLFQVLSLIEHSVWSSLLGEASALELHARLARRDGLAIFFLGLQIALLGCYGFMIWLCVSSRSVDDGSDTQVPEAGAQGARPAWMASS